MWLDDGNGRRDGCRTCVMVMSMAVNVFWMDIGVVAVVFGVTVIAVIMIVVIMVVMIMLMLMLMLMHMHMRMGHMWCLDLDFGLRCTGATALRVVPPRLSLRFYRMAVFMFMFIFMPMLVVVSVRVRVVRMLHIRPPVIRRRSLIGRVMVMHIVLAV